MTIDFGRMTFGKSFRAASQNRLRVAKGGNTAARLVAADLLDFTSGVSAR